MRVPLHVKQLVRRDQGTLFLSWNDGHDGPVSLQTLRDACPCAGCQGESVLFRKYVPPPPDVAAPGRYRLDSASPVGSYALKLVWGDGHGEGIYTWEHLRSLCECEGCEAGRNSTTQDG